jgi:2-dehydropantoate 2-reductase
MKVLIVGAGAIGSLVGAYIAKGGANVTLLDIGDHIRAIKQEGLRVQTIGGKSFSVKVRAFRDAHSINDVDLLILSVKTFHRIASH